MNIKRKRIEELIVQIMESNGSSAMMKGLRIGAAAMALFPALSQADQPFELSSLNGTNGFAINGIVANDQSGRFVHSAGDVNGDGLDDLIIGAVLADPNGAYSGQSYVVFGKSGGFGASLNLSSLNGANGFAINGIAVGDFSGGSVSSAGDVNGDGFDDLIIGAFRADPNGNTDSGQSYVVFGKSGGFSASLNLSSLNGSNGFAINGIAVGDRSGYSVSSAGDVNGDGFDDLIIGSPRTDSNGNTDSGQSYVVFGKSGGFSASLNLSSLNGANGFAINGIAVGDRSGYSVSSAGDVNGDGFDDLIIGAYGASPNGNTDSGQSYVVFGKSGGFSASLNLSSLNGSNGFAINGIVADDQSGYSVSSAGDVNGDGFDDLIIGALYADPNGKDSAGQSYVVFGKSGGFSASLNLSSLNGANGFAINGIAVGDRSSFSVSSAGDVNGDGFDDLIIGAFAADPNGDYSGQSYVVFGKNSFASSLELSSLISVTELSSLNGSNGFAINGIAVGNFSGRSVSSAGDVNGDKLDDLIIGANLADPNANPDSGQSYVIYGLNTDRVNNGQAHLFLQRSNIVMTALMTNGIYTGQKVTLATFQDANEKVVAVNDFNLDGKIDLATQSTTTLFLRKGPAYNVVKTINLMPNPFFNINPQIVASGNIYGNQSTNGIGYPEIIVKSGKYNNGILRDVWRAYANLGNWNFGLLSTPIYTATNNYNLVGCGRFMFNFSQPPNLFDDVLMENSTTVNKVTYARKATNILVNGPVVGYTNNFSAPVLGAANFKQANLVYELVSTNGNKVYIGIGNTAFSGYTLLPGERVVGPK